MWQQIQSRNPVVVPENVNAMEDVLKSIHSKIIHLDVAERKTYSKYLGDILEELTSKMKEDEVFKAVFKKVNFSGSYYENLRVRSPDEFDLNLLFQLPKEFKLVQIITDYVKPGFARLKLSNIPPLPGSKAQQKVMKFLDAENFILRDKVLGWLQSVVDTALNGINNQMELQNAIFIVRRSRSGPAITLNVVKYGINSVKFSVDLVPAFSFTKDQWPGHPIRKLTTDISSRDLEWFIVPKGPRSGDPSGQQWRMSFYMHEKKIMANNQNMKPTAKILKLLRDEQDWAGLSSYFIKTVFLWEMTCEECTGLFWRKSMSYLFYHMLCVLENCLASSYIPFFWHEKCNLLEHIDPLTTNDWANRITRIRKDICRKLANPDDVQRYINSVVQRKNQGQFGRANSDENVMPTEFIRVNPSFAQQAQQGQQQEERQGNSALALGITLGVAALGLAAGIAGWFATERNRRRQ